MIKKDMKNVKTWWKKDMENVKNAIEELNGDMIGRIGFSSCWHIHQNKDATKTMLIEIDDKKV
jgi:hypothetical protein